MNDLKDTSTADLIAEWGNLKERKRSLEGFVQAYGYAHDKANLARAERVLPMIAAELDRRATDAGLSIVDGFPTFKCRIESEAVGRLTSITVGIDAAELHALLGWLLLKEGGGNA